MRTRSREVDVRQGAGQRDPPAEAKCRLRVKGRRRNHISTTTGVTQLADDFPHRTRRQSRARKRAGPYHRRSLALNRSTYSHTQFLLWCDQGWGDTSWSEWQMDQSESPQWRTLSRSARYTWRLGGNLRRNCPGSCARRPFRGQESGDV